MIENLHLLRPLALVAAAALALGGGAYAGQDVLPKAETLLDGYVKASGGKEAYEKIRSTLTTGTIAVGDVKGTLKAYHAAPNLSYTLIEFEGIGRFEEGVDGRNAWGLDAMNGARLKEGDHKALSLRMATFNAPLHWRKLNRKVETLALEPLDGRDHYKVRLTPESGGDMTVWFDKQTGLQSRLALTANLNGTDTAIEVDFSDYREVAGVKLAHKVRQRVLGREQIVTIERVEVNADIPKERFDPPPAVTALIDAK